MKTILLSTCIFFASRIFSQSGPFKIIGKIGHYNAPATIWLSYHTTEGDNITDTCILSDGCFELEGILKSPIRAAQLMLFTKGQPSFDDNNGTVIWLEPGIIEIKTNQWLREAKITGSKLNTEQAEFDKQLKPYNDRQNALNDVHSAVFFNNQNTAEFKTYQNRSAAIFRQSLPVYRQFIIRHPYSLVSLAVLTDYCQLKYGAKVGLSEIEPLFTGLSAHVKSSAMGEKYQEQLVKWKSVDIGSTAPDFTLFDQNRKPVKLSDFKGKYVLLDFWASWCHPCREENPNLIKQYGLYKDKNFIILSVSLDEEKFRDQWLKAIEKDKLTWPQVVGKKENNEARLKFAVLSIPDNFLISPEGVVIAKSLRGEELNHKLKEVLNEK